MNKKYILKKIIGVILIQSFISSCNSPKERTAVINSEIASQLVKVENLHDVTNMQNKAYFYQNEIHLNKKSNDKTQLLKVDSDVQKVLDLVKNEKNKTDLINHLKTGWISFVVLTDQVKIFKVVSKDYLKTESSSTSNQKIYRIDELVKIKTENLLQNQIDVTTAHSELPVSKLRFVELTSIAIDKYGILDFQKTKYYNEKMAILNVDERPFDLSTHLVLKQEILPSTTTEPSER